VSQRSFIAARWRAGQDPVEDRSLRQRPGNALIVKAVELCHARGMSYVKYGQFRYGNQRTRLSWSSNCAMVSGGPGPRYTIPLTRKGRVAVALGVHRELRALVPQSVLASHGACDQWYSARVPRAGVAQR